MCEWMIESDSRTYPRDNLERDFLFDILDIKTEDGILIKEKIRLYLIV